MIVLDASAAVCALLHEGPARVLFTTEQLHAPHVVDAEVASTLRRLVGAGHLRSAQGWQALDRWRRSGVARYELAGLLERVWSLRENLSAYDAGYVALAEALDCSVVTADARISRAPGIRCPVTVVPR